MRKFNIFLLGLIVGCATLWAFNAYAAPFSTGVGGTGTTTPSGILWGDNTPGDALSTLIVGSGLSLTGSTLTSNAVTPTFGTSSLSALYPLKYTQSSSLAQFSTLFGTTTTWGIANNQFIYTGNTGIPLGVASSSLDLPNTALQNSSVTVNTNSPLGGGGAVSLGGSALTLTCSSCNTSSASVTSIGLSSTNATLTIGSTPVTTSGIITADLNLAHSNTWSVLQQFNGQASTTALSVYNSLFVGGIATTTINGGATSTFNGAITVSNSQATSTFDKGIQTTAINLTSSSASSTATNGINLSGGCFAENNICLPTTSKNNQYSYASTTPSAINSNSGMITLTTPTLISIPSGTFTASSTIVISGDMTFVSGGSISNQGDIEIDANGSALYTIQPSSSCTAISGTCQVMFSIVILANNSTSAQNETANVTAFKGTSFYDFSSGNSSSVALSGAVALTLKFVSLSGSSNNATLNEYSIVVVP